MVKLLMQSNKFWRSVVVWRSYKFLEDSVDIEFFVKKTCRKIAERLSFVLWLEY